MQLTALLAIAACLGPALAAPIGTTSNPTSTVAMASKASIPVPILAALIAQQNHILEPRDPKHKKQQKEAPTIPAKRIPDVLPLTKPTPTPLTHESLMAYRHSMEFPVVEPRDAEHKKQLKKPNSDDCMFQPAGWEKLTGMKCLADTRCQYENACAPNFCGVGTCDGQ